MIEEGLNPPVQRWNPQAGPGSDGGWSPGAVCSAAVNPGSVREPGRCLPAALKCRTEASQTLMDFYRNADWSWTLTRNCRLHSGFSVSFHTDFICWLCERKAAVIQALIVLTFDIWSLFKLCCVVVLHAVAVCNLHSWIIKGLLVLALFPPSSAEPMRWRDPPVVLPGLGR